MVTPVEDFTGQAAPVAADAPDAPPSAAEQFAAPKPGANNFHQRLTGGFARFGGVAPAASDYQSLAASSAMRSESPGRIGFASAGGLRGESPGRIGFASAGGLRGESPGGIGFAPVGTDAPDQRLREIALKAQYAPGSLRPNDFHRLAQRQGVEAMPGAFGSAAAGPDNPRSIEGTMAGNNRSREAGSLSEANQTMNREKMMEESKTATAKGRAAAATIKTHGADLGMTEDEIKAHLAQRPDETQNEYSARLLETVAQAHTTNTARRQQAALESADAARASAAEARATKGELDAEKFQNSALNAEAARAIAEQRLGLQRERFQAGWGPYESLEEAKAQVEQAKAQGLDMVVQSNPKGGFRVARVGEKKDDWLTEAIKAMGEAGETNPAPVRAASAGGITSVEPRVTLSTGGLIPAGTPITIEAMNKLVNDAPPTQRAQLAAAAREALRAANHTDKKK